MNLAMRMGPFLGCAGGQNSNGFERFEGNRSEQGLTFYFGS